MIYADCNSGTGIHPKVADKMSVLLTQHVANPSQILTPLGKQAHLLVEEAREQIARLVDSSPDEVVFTSGATESCFLAIFGSYLARKNKTQIVSSSIEHPAVSTACQTVVSLGGIEEKIINTEQTGEISIEEFCQNIKSEKTFLVNLMAANNETGICSSWKDLAAYCLDKQINFHCDATQWIGRMPFSFRKSNIDLLSFSSHKLGGPQGIGALIIKKGTPWISPMPGGGQQSSHRGGTEAVVAISGFGELAKLSKNRFHNSHARDYFEQTVLENLAGLEIVGKSLERLPNTSMLIIDGVAGTDLVQSLARKGIIISSGSACSLGAGSKTLEAMGYSERQFRSAARISFDLQVSTEQAQEVADALIVEVQRIREQNVTELNNL